jgi:hypothetical protein
MVVCPLCGLSQNAAPDCQQCGRSLTGLSQKAVWEPPPNNAPARRDDAEDDAIIRCAQCGCLGVRGKGCKNCGVRIPLAE